MHTLETLGIAVLLIGFITYKQTRWQPVRLAKLLRMPVIFIVAGLLMVPQSAQQLPAGWHLDALDAALLGVELLVGVGAGWWMGRLTQIRTVDGVVSSRLGGRGVAVWIGFIAVRIGLGLAATAIGAPLVGLSATIFFVVAAIKIVQTVVIRERLASQRHTEQEPAQPVPAGLR